MQPHKIILIEVISYVVLYILASNYNPSSSGGDAAGNGMGRGLLMLLIMAIFFFIAIALTVTNYFVLKGATVHPGIKWLAYVPIGISVAHILYTIVFG